MRAITSKKAQRTGMALGGIGTGSVELSPDGRLSHWHIFNLGPWAAVDPVSQGCQELVGDQENLLPFYIRTQEQDGTVKVRSMMHNLEPDEFRSMMYSWNKEIETIRWKADFPACCLDYIEEELPAEIRAQYLSPINIHDAKTSGTPGFYVVYTLKNRSEQPIKVSILGKVKNPIGRGLEQRKLHNSLEQDGERTTLTFMGTSEQKVQMNGSMSLGTSGGETSYILGEYRDYMTNYVLGDAFGVTEESLLFYFQEHGALPDQGVKENLFARIPLTDLEMLTDEQLETVWEQWMKLPSVKQPSLRIEEVVPMGLSTREGRMRFLQMIGRRFSDEKSEELWGDGALCSSVELEPGEEKQIRFYVSWHFPNHLSNGRNLGHCYSNWFQNSKKVNDFLYRNEERICHKAEQLSKLLISTDLEESMAANWGIHLNTLVKSSWWTAADEFGIWEGYGSCGFHTTDITYHGSFGLAALFPELQMKQMEMGAGFQRADGRVHHFFAPDFGSVDEGYDRVDMNPQFVLLVARDYLWTDDLAYLKRMWEPVKRAMANTQNLDQDHDGLPDQDTRCNTYDAWNFQGTPAYLSGLWLAALLAMIRLCTDLGETEQAAYWSACYEQGRQSFDEKLWNGNYYSLWVDGDERDDCCMTDQLDGPWYAQLVGLGSLISPEKQTKTLSFIWNQNYHEESGLVNAGYPKGVKPTLYTYQNVQANANWSGIEFIFASYLLEQGMTEEAIRISQNVEARYRRAGRIYNHEECGDYYYRALSSWALLLSASGFKWDAPQKRLTIQPAMASVQVPWFTPFGSGLIRCSDDQLMIQCEEGCLECRTLVWNGNSREFQDLMVLKEGQHIVIQ